MCILSQYWCNHVTIFKCNLKTALCLRQVKTLLKAGANCNTCAIAKHKILVGWRKELLLENHQIHVMFDGLISDGEDEDVNLLH